MANYCSSNDCSLCAYINNFCQANVIAFICYQFQWRIIRSIDVNSDTRDRTAVSTYLLSIFAPAFAELLGQITKRLIAASGRINKETTLHAPKGRSREINRWVWGYALSWLYPRHLQWHFYFIGYVQTGCACGKNSEKYVPQVDNSSISRN